PFRLFVAGLVDETEVSLLNRYFGQSALSPAPDRRSYADPHLGDLQSILLRVEDKMQSSIRVGKRMVNRLHPDYYPVLVTNEILGGYFGSRLMKNIREDKGYTYGIYSQINHFSHASQLVIGTDVNKEVTRQTLDEIRKEILRLQTEPVPAEELQTAKNYMTGQFVGSLNTPFEIADRHKVRILNQLPDDYSLRFIERIQAVTAEQVLEAAQAWFQWETLVEVVAGDK
ncbi:MAG: insulinase family protein, partial [Siphonobacter aquaeclarae]|nr:insulinase family protein [Siphonobacter aquaeclarae]